MRLHFANSATVRVKQKLVCKKSSGSINLNVRYGLLEHPVLGPVIIDAGYAPRIVAGMRRSPALQIYSAILRPRISINGDPVRVLADLGYQLNDVKHVILTHLHADHVGYLPLFEGARIHMPEACRRIVLENPLFSALKEGIFRELLPKPEKQSITAFEASKLVHIPEGLGDGRDILADGSCLSVSLPGHALGHTGLYFPFIEEPMLYAVDAAWSREALLQNRAPGFPANLVAHNHKREITTMKRLQTFTDRGGRLALCHEAEATPWDIPSTFRLAAK
jgi:glyoxylase-like metal-dependent hydrolase (beta-lactamase superfamily II)